MQLAADALEDLLRFPNPSWFRGFLLLLLLNVLGNLEVGLRVCLLEKLSSGQLRFAVVARVAEREWLNHVLREGRLLLGRQELSSGDAFADLLVLPLVHLIVGLVLGALRMSRVELFASLLALFHAGDDGHVDALLFAAAALNFVFFSDVSFAFLLVFFFLLERDELA